MKKNYLMCLGLLFIFLTIPTQAKSIQLTIDGVQIVGAGAPVLENGTTLVPIRIISEHLGASVDYIKEIKCITIKKENKVIVMKLGEKECTANGEQFVLSIAPKMIKGTTMVPLRFISDALDCEVGWDKDTETVSISSQVIKVQNDGTITIKNPVRIDGKPFVHLSVLEKVVDSVEKTHIWDIKKDGKVMSLSQDKEVSFAPNLDRNSIGRSSVIVKTVNKEPMFPIDFIGEHLNIEVRYEEDTDILYVKNKGPNPYTYLTGTVRDIEGFFLTFDGMPVSDVEVRLSQGTIEVRPMDPKPILSAENTKPLQLRTKTDKNGHFAFKDVDIEGAYFFEIQCGNGTVNGNIFIYNPLQVEMPIIYKVR